MKAIFFQEHGGPEKLQWGDLPDPVPDADEVVVRVKACALNHVDLWVLKGGPAYPVQRPHVLGADIAGVIESVGSGVTDLKPGLRVVVAPGIHCGQCAPCREGYDNRCESYSILGAKFWGGYAEKVKVPARNILPIPESLAFEQAAAFPLTFLTAWHMLLTRAGLKSGQQIIVIGASSGIGSAAIQIAKMHGASVLATVTSDEKIAPARALGADAVVNSTKESIAHMARAWTQKRGVDIVFEHVGPATWDQSIGSLAPGGKLVTCGATTGPEVKLELRYLFSRELSVIGARMGFRRELDEILKAVAAGRLKPVVAKTFPLAKASAALEFLDQRKHFGKVVLLP